MAQAAPPVPLKRFLTVDQDLGLLPAGRRRTLAVVQSIRPWGHYNMSNRINLLARFAQGLLAIAATGVSVLALQLAMLA